MVCEGLLRMDGGRDRDSLRDTGNSGRAWVSMAKGREKGGEGADEWDDWIRASRGCGLVFRGSGCRQTVNDTEKRKKTKVLRLRFLSGWNTDTQTGNRAIRNQPS